MVTQGAVARSDDTVTPEEAIKDPYLLEFLSLKDEYSESEFEAALIPRLEDFLLKLGKPPRGRKSAKGDIPGGG